MVLRFFVLTIAAGALMAAPPSVSVDGSSVPVRRCARIAGLADPLQAAARLAHLEPAERRRRLATLLRADLAGRARPVLARLATDRATDVRALWAAGVVCASAPETTWEAVGRLEEVAAVFADPPRLEAGIADAGPGEPNPAVPPEAPLVALHVPELWERGFFGQEVVVALIDTGVDMAHPDLAHAIWTNPGEIPDNGVDDDGNGYVDDVRGWDFASNDNDPSDSAGHGTNAAGLIAGNGSSGSQTGAAPGVRLMVIRRGTTQAALWESSQYALDNGARIISQSTSWKWSFTPDYASWRRQTDTELAFGVIHVNSGGNTGLDSSGTEPVPYNVAAPANAPPPWHVPEQTPQAGVSSVLGIGNVRADSHVIDERSPWGPSEWTDIALHVDPTWPWPMPPEYQDYPVWDGSPGLGKPDLVAPGEGSLTTALGGGYAVFGGTSAATPRVAAVLALLVSAVPEASPAELARAVLTTARDLGPPGRDERHGMGMPDAEAALAALGPPLSVTAVTVVDPGPPRGDGDGAADEGEIVRLALTVENTGSAPLDDVELHLLEGPGARPRDRLARLGTLPGLSSATSSAGDLSVELLPGTCGAFLALPVELRAGGTRRIETLHLPVGTETRTALIDADFESPAGFVTGGDATGGAFVREDPVGTTEAGVPANPEDDSTPDPGTLCWVTGNGPVDPAAADVDGGTATLSSPPVDATGYGEVDLIYRRWFHGSDVEAADRFRVEARPDDGAAWVLLEEIAAGEPRWRRRRIVLSDLLVPGAATALRFAVTDGAGDTVVEGAVDDLLLEGVDLACTVWSIPTDPAPADPGPTLRLAPLAGRHVEMSWASPPGGDPPWGYRVRGSAAPDGPFADDGLPTRAPWIEVDGLLGLAPGAARFYLVESLGDAP